MNLKRITWPVALISTVIVLFMTYMGKLPNDMMGSFALMFILGMLFGELGDRIPFVRDWLGGGPIFCIFGPALMIYFKVLPASTVTMMKDFMNKTNFFAFFIAIMISGAMFTISQKIIVKATLKFFPTIVGGVAAAFGLAALGGLITGYGAKEAIYYLAIPIMGGGVGAGAVPLSQIYAKAAGIDATAMLSTVMPAVILGNVASIIASALMNRLGNAKPKWTGNGEIMKIADPILKRDIEEDKEARESSSMTIESLGSGFFVAISFYMLAEAISRFLFPNVHAFVWLILLLTITKETKLLPKHLELGTIQWSQVWTKNLLYAALVPIGIGFIDIGQVITSISNPAYVIIVLLTVIGAIIGSGLVGQLLGLYPVEASLAGGLCMSNMAQTGDLACLAAAKRMDLLPYSAYSSRIGGSFMLILAGFLVALLGM